jgi:hypothetical protein
MGTSDISKPDTLGDGCPVAKSQKSNNDGLVSGCPVVKGGAGGETHVRTARLKSDDIPCHGPVVAVAFSSRETVESSAVFQPKQRPEKASREATNPTSARTSGPLSIAAFAFRINVNPGRQRRPNENGFSMKIIAMACHASHLQKLFGLRTTAIRFLPRNLEVRRSKTQLTGNTNES